jgi:hypothetical protein
MNSKKSNVRTIWKYFLLLPIMVLFTWFIYQPAAQSQTVSSNSKKESNQHLNIQNEMKTEGNWFASIQGETVNIEFRGSKNNSSSNSFELSDFSNLPRDKQGDFTLIREVGTMSFAGKFDGNKGTGTYNFTPDKEYAAALVKEGVVSTKDSDLMIFFLMNVKASYVQMLKKNGYNNLDIDQILPLVSLHIDEAYITSIKEAGVTAIDLDQLLAFKSLSISKEFIVEIHNAGYKNNTPDDIIALKSQGIGVK